MAKQWSPKPRIGVRFLAPSPVLRVGEVASRLPHKQETGGAIPSPATNIAIGLK